MRLYFVVRAEQADERAFDGRVVEYLPELGHGFGDGVAGIVVQRVELGGDGLVEPGGQFRFDEVVAGDEETGHLRVAEQMLIHRR